MESIKIIKIGGKVIEEKEAFNQFIEDFSKIKGPKILIHGGGKTANDISEKLGIFPEIIEGRRKTDAETLDIAMMVYGGLINKKIVAQLQSKGCQAIGMSGADLNIIEAKKRNPEPIDYGFVGDITKVNTEPILNLLNQGITPVLASLTHDTRGQMLNTNADTIASEIAAALSKTNEVELFYCFEKPGVLKDPKNDASLISEIKRKDFEVMRENGSVADGMIPKLDNAFKTMDEGVGKVSILSFENIKHINSPEFKGTMLYL